MDTSVLHDMASDLLSALVSHWADGPALPSRRFVTIGDTAHDCPQLTVGIIRVARGLPGAEETIRAERCYVARTAQFVVELIRCVTALEEGAKSPDAVKLDAEAAEIARDWGAMHNALTGAYEDRSLFGDCSQVLFGPAEAITPQGGVAGWRMQVFATI